MRPRGVYASACILSTGMDLRRYPFVTVSGLHDILIVAATALPVLYVPVVLVLLDREGPRSQPVRPIVMLLYALVFVNAELPALIGIGTFRATDEGPVGMPGLLLLAGVVVAVVFGLILAVGPAADSALAGTVTASRRSLRQWLAMGLIAILVLALPVASSASYAHFSGWSFRTVFAIMSAIFAAVSIVGFLLERALALLTRLLRSRARTYRSIVILFRRRPGARQEYRQLKAEEADKDYAALVHEHHYQDHCPDSHLPDGQDSARARSGVNQRCSLADLDHQIALAGQTRAALHAARLPASRA